MPKITVEGLEELQKKLRKDASMDKVKATVRLNGSELMRKMMRKAQFRGHYKGKKFVKPTGQTKRSIGLEIIDGGFTAVVEPGTEYSPYLEYGTRYMDAQPFVNPALNEQAPIFKSDMGKLVK